MNYLFIIAINIFTWSTTSYSNDIKMQNQLMYSKTLPPLPATTTLRETDSFYNKKTDYSKFNGRVTDRDNTRDIIKVISKEKNIKFFNIGDKLNFWVGETKSSKLCKGFIRSIEPDYFVLKIQDLDICYTKRYYLRRGTILHFNSNILNERVKEASIHRQILLRRREDFFGQLNNINHFLWTYDQQKIQLALDYDKKLVDLERAKERAVDTFLIRKKEQLQLQKELIYRVDALNADLDHFRVEKKHKFDRWNLDHGLGLPVGNRPQEIRER